MAAFDLRPRSATELVDATIQIYKRDPASFMLAMALINVPWTIIARVFVMDGPRLAPGPGTVAVFGIASVLVYAFAAGTTMLLASGVYLGRPISVGTAFATVGKRALTLTVTVWAFGLLCFVGAFLLIVPMVYVFARYFAVRQVVLLEDGATGTAFSRSSTLSKDLKIHILASLLLAFFLVFVVSVGGMLATAWIPSELVQTVLQTAITIVVTPAIGIAETLLYYDARIRKEGFDVQFLAGRHDQAGVLEMLGSVNAPAI